MRSIPQKPCDAHDTSALSAEYRGDGLTGMVIRWAQRILSVAAVLLVSVLVGVTFGLVPPELGARLSELFRGSSSRERDDASDDA